MKNKKDNDEYIKKHIDKYYEQWFAINGFYSRWAKIHGTTDCAIFTLQMIFYYKGSCTLKFICDKLSLPKQTVASVLNSLEKKGYINKKINPNDKRHKFIAFTKKGMSYAKPILEELEQTEIAMFKSLSDGNMESYIEIGEEILKFMTDSLDKQKNIKKM